MVGTLALCPPYLCLRRAHLGKEAVDRAAQHAGLVVELAGVAQHLGSRPAGRLRRRGDAADMGVDLAGAGRDLLDVARDLARRLALLLDRGGIAEVISLICAMVCVMPLIAATASLVDCCMAATWPEISSVAFAVWLASAFTSEATTAKPRPDSPARAASMVALSASRVVCASIEWVSLTTSPIFSPRVDSA